MKPTSGIKNSYSIAHDGSTWLKWDLHIHTPETKLSNKYVVTNEEDVWNKFIEKIDTSDVKVFGITDYFSVDNYETFLNKYSLKEHNGIEKVFFPNIEFRLDISVNKNAEEVNIHVIFDCDVDIEEIKRFLDHLETNIQESGRKIPCSKLSSEQVIKAAINIDDLKEKLETIFGDKKCFIIGVAVNNGGILPDTNSPRKMNISDNIDRECEFLFGGRQHVDYYLRTNRYDNEEISSPKPVISCCDAHSFEDLDTKLGKGQFCTWIKSLPTFNGLRQILYEPEDRIIIKITEPDYKEPHNIIRSISINDNTENKKIFGNQRILVNKNLNTIIGGKSSGKSLLLYSLARSIDIGQLNRLHEKFEDFKDYNIENVKFTVEWADGTVNTTDADDYFDIENIGLNHKITYIPQLYINHLAEKNGREELNNLIDEILLNNIEYKNFKINIDDEITKINKHMFTALNTLIELRNELISISDEKKEYSTSEKYDLEINTLTDQYNKLNESSSFTEDEITDYKKLKSDLAEYENRLIQFNNEIYYLKQIQNEIEQNSYNLLGNNENNTLGSLYKYSNKLIKSRIDISKIIEIVKSGYSYINQTINQEFSIEAIENDIRSIKDKKEKTEQNLVKYNDKIGSKSELKDIVEKLDEMKRKKNYAVELELKFAAILTEYKKIKNTISEMLANRNKLYKSIKEYINENMRDLGSEINLSCNLLYRLDDCKLFEYINRQHKNNNIQKLFDETNKLVHYDFLPTFFSNFIKIEGNCLHFKDKSNQPLKERTNLESVYQTLIEDNFYIAYDVTYKGDNLLQMSPGKKGTVLLILFLELSTSENPILIDQPEDNLDNRTIYDLLCQMIRRKKKDRQIIIVTHNANLVVNTDAENVIVANQEGQDSSTASGISRTKFEYVNGPIELSFTNTRFGKILSKMGIKQHICDILEGGKEAFKLRELKYQGD
jgi:ABC-type polar amino acid transport system ATPase subunit